MIYLGNRVVECSLFVYNKGIETQGNCESRMRDICRRRGGIEYMCKVSKELFHDGWMEGQRIGLLEGKREVAIRLLAKGMTDEQTADLVDCSLPVVREWRKGTKAK